MENNEILTNDEVMESAAEVVKTGTKCGAKTFIGFGLGVIAGVVICKVAKPIAQKIKLRRCAVIPVGEADPETEEPVGDEADSEE